MIPTLESDRLILRSFRQSDLDAHAAMMAKPEVARWVAQHRPLDRFEAWWDMCRLAGHWVIKGFGPFAVELKETRTYLGRISLFDPEGGAGLELAWTLDSDHWGHGYATEGARRVMTYAFQERGFEKLISLIDPENTPSVRVAERIGETYERDWTHQGEIYRIYAISRETWAAASKRS